MKITCNSCGSKYTIADAKVQGKKVKVRCKGCKESILVDGTKIGSEGSAGTTDESEPESDADEMVSAPGASESMTTDEGPKKDLWSVNLSDDDSRDMTLEELVAGWKNGTVTSDAYVWKDGMGDWKPILEVGELKLKLGSSPKKGGVVSSASPAAAAAAGGGMDDLFGGVGSAGNEPGDVAKPGPPGAAAAPTGARNDSSVLFSLDSLNSAGAPAAPQTSSSANALFAGLDSGSASLTNNNADLLMAPAKEPPPAPAGNRAAPVAAAPASKGKGGLIAAILGAAVIIGGAVMFLSGGEDPEGEQKEGAAATADKSEEDKKAEQELAEKMAKLEKMEAELKKAKEEAKKDDKAEEEEKKKEEELAKEKEEAEKKEEEEKKAAEASGSSSSSSSSSTSPAPAPKPSGGAAFDVGAARAALQAAAANAAGCGKPGGPTGSGKVQVTFSTSGRVTSANVVAGPFGGTAVGGCVASTFRRARVPAFSGSPQTVAKSFTVN